MSDIVIGGWSDTWRTDLGYASVRPPDIRPPPQTISYTYHMSRVGFYGEDQSEALQRHVVLSHTTSWLITRVRLTSDLPVPSAPDLPVSHVVWHNTSMGGIMPYHMAGKSKRERSVKGSFPPAVFRNQFEWRWAWRAQTTRVAVRGRAWSFDRRTPSTRNEEGHPDPDAGRDHSLNVIFKLLTVCHSINELASLPATETFLFTHNYGGK